MMDFIDRILSENVFITSVSFNETQMEVSFLEHIDQKEDVMMIRSMVLIHEGNVQLQRAFVDLQEILRDVVDEGYFQLRNSTSQSTVRDRFLAKRREEQAEAARKLQANNDDA
jgi:hypothetical protein